MGKSPHDQRRDIERPQSSAIVRWATAAGIPANFAFRTEFSLRSPLHLRITRMKLDFFLRRASSLMARSLRRIHPDVDEPVLFIAWAPHFYQFALHQQVKFFLSAWRVAV